MGVKDRMDMLCGESLESLKTLSFLHGTPGGETPVARMMCDAWRNDGWTVAQFGNYALTAASPDWDDSLPTVMLCAHADSPGFIIQSLIGDGRSGIAIKLGGPRLPENGDAAVLVRQDGQVFFPGMLKVAVHDNENTIIVEAQEGHRLKRGDRVCYAPCFEVTDDGFVKASFLDNRIGCWALLQVSHRLPLNGGRGVNVILALTGREEMTGFGAHVLAASVKADLVVCLDATYVDHTQQVEFSKGPVLTISDNSTLLCPEVCKAVETVFEQWNLPLQEEIYNFSGTDARAFPLHGCACPVMAILVPTEGNHSPKETAALKDINDYMQMCLNFCQDSVALETIRNAWRLVPEC